MQTKNLNYVITNLSELNVELKNAMRRMDYMFNVKWPLAHLKTAESYLIAAGQKTASTGMSDWQKYLHPNYQRRTFFPSIWSAEELTNWGNFEVE
jgi:tryptophan 2,3-dioxygenase